MTKRSADTRGRGSREPRPGVVRVDDRPKPGEDQDPERGPYRPRVFGECHNGHAVNGMGVCEPRNAGGCPAPIEPAGPAPARTPKE